MWCLLGSACSHVPSLRRTASWLRELENLGKHRHHGVPFDQVRRYLMESLICKKPSCSVSICFRLKKNSKMFEWNQENDFSNNKRNSQSLIHGWDLSWHGFDEAQGTPCYLFISEDADWGVGSGLRLVKVCQYFYYKPLFSGVSCALSICWATANK